MGEVWVPTATAARVSRLECLKLGVYAGQLGHEDPFLIIISRPSRDRQPTLIPHETASPHALCYSNLIWLLVILNHLNGSSRAHLPAVRDDRARAGLWLDAVPETEREAPQTGPWTSAALQCPRMSGSLEGKQSVAKG